MSDAPPPGWDQPGGGQPGAFPGPQGRLPAPPPGWTQQPGQPPWGRAAPAGQPPPPGYVPYHPYGGQVREHPNGTTILVLGILSLVLCGLLGPVAWSMGSKALREIDSDPTAIYTNRANVKAGRICGIISSCLLIIAAAFFVILIAAAAGTA